MKKKNKEKDYIKADRRGRREAELEDGNDWTAVHKVHKSKKAYSRKDKHRKKSEPTK